MSNDGTFMRILAIFLFAILPVLGHAEVMDKEFSILTIIIFGILGGLLGYLAARFKPLLLLVLLPVIGLFFYFQLAELLDPYVGPAMAVEAGRLYVFISWAAPALVVMGVGAGFAWRYSRRKHTSSSSEV